MDLDTFFLQPINTNPNPNPNFANAQGSAIVSNYSHSSSSAAVNAVAGALLEGGLAEAISNAEATFFNDPAFSSVFSSSGLISQGGATQGIVESQAQVIASFSLNANNTFSFDFNADLNLDAKEIEDSDTEYSEAESGAAIAVLDTTNINDPQLISYFALNGELISSDFIGDADFGASSDVTLDFTDVNTDINGNNGIDLVSGFATGSYQRTVNSNINLTVVSVNTSGVRLSSDTLINNLGGDVLYGTIGDDDLYGTGAGDKVYGSLGHDFIRGEGGNDTIEGGKGDDELIGNDGDDRLFGSYGKDSIEGNQGNDIAYGSMGQDWLSGNSGQDTLYGGIDDDTLYGGQEDDLLFGDAGTELNNIHVYGGHQYLLTSEVGTWEEAQAEAERLGGNLVTINSAAEQAWLENNFDTDVDLWIGLTDKDQEGTFKWVSGESVTYTNWESSQPDNWGGNQDYVRLWAGRDGEWADYFEDAQFQGIIEISSAGNSPEDEIGGQDELNGDFGDDTLVGGVDDDTLNGGADDDVLFGDGVNFNDEESELDDAEVYGGHRYLLTSDSGSWQEAQAEAQALGGNLVTLNDAGEEAWLKSTFGNETLWLGLTDQNAEGQFEWVSGESVTYTNWKPGQPNNYGGNQDYAVMNSGNTGKWDDEENNRNFRGIIEIPSIADSDDSQIGGSDSLTGAEGDDILIGGGGNDVLTGGFDSDDLTGGNGSDRFVFVRDESLFYGEYDVITDFQVGEDTIEFRGWGSINATNWYNSVVSQGRIWNTSEGALFESNYGGHILFEEVTVNELSGSDFTFV